MRLTTVLLCALTFLSAIIDEPLYSQQVAVNDSNLVYLSDYLQYAAINNAGLKAAFEQWKAAVEQLPQAQSLPDPRFTYGYFIKEVETRAGPQRQRFGIMQVFPWFGKIEARTDAAAVAAKAAWKRYEAAKLKLFFEVKDAFYEYAYLVRALQIARENLELIKYFEEVARTKYAAAAAAHPDIIRAQVELAKLDDVHKSLEQMREPVVARLNASLNRPTFELLPWPKPDEPKLVEIDHKKMMMILKKTNPQLEALSFEVLASKSNLELAKKNFYPDIGAGVDWIQTDDAITPGVADDGKDPVILMFSINLPIWRDGLKAAERQAKANLRQIEQERLETENTLIAEAQRRLYDLEDSNRKTKLYGDALIPKAEELLNASQTAYQSGTVDFLSLIDAQRTLLMFQLHYERAITNSQQRLAELEMLVGAQLPTLSEK